MSIVCVCVCSLFGNIQEEVVKDCESVRAQQQQHVQQHSCTLDECFQLYTKEEQVTHTVHNSAAFLLEILTDPLESGSSYITQLKMSKRV